MAEAPKAQVQVCPRNRALVEFRKVNAGEPQIPNRKALVPSNQLRKAVALPLNANARNGSFGVKPIVLDALAQRPVNHLMSDTKVAPPHPTMATPAFGFRHPHIPPDNRSDGPARGPLLISTPPHLSGLSNQRKSTSCITFLTSELWPSYGHDIG